MDPRTLCSFKLVVPHTCAGLRQGTLEWVKGYRRCLWLNDNSDHGNWILLSELPCPPHQHCGKSWNTALETVFPLPGCPAFWGWISSFEGPHCGKSCLCFFPKVGEFVLLLELSCHQYVTFYSLRSKGSSLSWDSCPLVLQVKRRNVEGHEIPCPKTWPKLGQFFIQCPTIPLAQPRMLEPHGWKKWPSWAAIISPAEPAVHRAHDKGIQGQVW